MLLYSILYVGHLEFTRGMNPTAFSTPLAGGRHVWCLFHDKKRVRGDLTSAWCERHVSDIQMAQLTCHCLHCCLLKRGLCPKKDISLNLTPPKKRKQVESGACIIHCRNETTAEPITKFGE